MYVYTTGTGRQELARNDVTGSRSFAVIKTEAERRGNGRRENKGSPRNTDMGEERQPGATR